jgi:hypothetical protein
MKLEDSLDRLVQRLCIVRLDPSAEVGYDLMSGALIWSDENISGLTVEEMGCLRVILRYRTSVIVGQPDQRFRGLWDKLQAKYPEWVGFSTNRCQASETLLKLYNKHKNASRKYVKKMS